VKQHALSLLALTMALSSVTAFAEQPLGDPMQASADLVFVSPTGITHELTAATDLVAGPNVSRTEPVAIGRISSGSTELSSVVVEWVSGTAGASSQYRTVTGTNTGGTLNLGLTSGGTSTSPLYGAGRRLPAEGGPTATEFSYHISKNGSVQNVQADTYNIILKAQAYVP
jgi:Saf-pilin pilus formation protein